MTRVFLQVAIPVLYVYDPDEDPERVPGFDMNLLPVTSRVLKEHAGTLNVTVITGTPTTPEELPEAFTRLALSLPDLQRASPEAGALALAELAMENFDGEAVRAALDRLLSEREKRAKEEVEGRYGA